MWRNVTLNIKRCDDLSLRGWESKLFFGFVFFFSKELEKDFKWLLNIHQHLVENWMEVCQIQFLPILNVCILKVFYFLAFQILFIGIFFSLSSQYLLFKFTCWLDYTILTAFFWTSQLFCSVFQLRGFKVGCFFFFLIFDLPVTIEYYAGLFFFFLVGCSSVSFSFFFTY